MSKSGMIAVLTGLLGLLFCLVAPSSSGDEGMWLPGSIGRELDHQKLQKMGLKLAPEQIWSTEKPSVSDAVVQVIEFQTEGRSRGTVFGFGSAAFVSPKGLILTNHHVAFDAIAANSTPENDYVEEGFRAATMADEVPCPKTGVRVCIAYNDITALVMADVNEGDTATVRNQKVIKATEAILKSAKSEGLIDPEVKISHSGLRYHLIAYDTFKDVRLVYAPKRMIGEYGGDIDNWMWPRHTGDFTYLRAYVAPDGSRADYSKDNVPYDSVRHLRLNVQGIAENDFCFIMGFPGTTYRERSSYSVEYRERILFPQQIKAFEAEIARLEAQGANDPAKRIANLSTIKSLANTKKNFTGMLEGLSRTGLVNTQRAEEIEFQKWIEADPERKERWGALYPRLVTLYARLLNSDRLFNLLRREMGKPMFAVFSNAAAIRAAGPDANFSQERKVGLIKALKTVVDGKDLAEQRSEFKAFITMIKDLPQGEWPKALFFEELDDVDAWLKNTFKRALTGEDVDVIFSTDPMVLSRSTEGGIRLGYALGEQLARLTAERAEFSAEIGDLRFGLQAARKEWRGNFGYPDADSTLRFTYGRVRGYSPRDAVVMEPFTTAEGVLQKHSGSNPFDAPAKVRDLVKNKNWGSWADAKKGTLVCNFLSDNDITGGNSGSPIMNGAGEMIGIAFDGNYEAMTSDFQFMPSITRTINVDIRYVLWCTELVDGMQRLIDEMIVVR